MNPTRTIPLALGIALPLWWLGRRQLSFERAVIHRGETFEREVSRAFEERDRQSNRWSKELLREVERAFKRGARR